MLSFKPSMDLFSFFRPSIEKSILMHLVVYGLVFRLDLGHNSQRVILVTAA